MPATVPPVEGEAVEVTPAQIGGAPWPGGVLGGLFGVWDADEVATQLDVDGLPVDLDAVPVGGWDLSVTVLPEWVGAYAQVVEVGQPGDVAGGSDAVEIVPLEGVTRASTSNDRAFAAAGGSTMPVQGVILAEVEASTGGTLVAWAVRNTTSASRRVFEIETRWIGAVAEVSAVLRQHTTVLRSPWVEAAGITTGARWIVRAAFNAAAPASTQLAIAAGQPGGTVVSGSATVAGVNMAIVGVDLLPSLCVFGVPTVMGFAGQAAGAVQAAWFDSATAADLQAVVDAGSIRAWGGVGGASTVGYCYPAATESDGDAIASGAQLEGATWTLQAGTARLTAGGLNVPLP